MNRADVHCPTLHRVASLPIVWSARLRLSSLAPELRLLSTPIGRLRVVGTLEGISFLVLLGIAMPLKYLAGFPEAVQVVGWVHGLLFMLFVAVVADARAAGQLDWWQTLGALVASVLPFGPFVFDARLRRADPIIASS